MKRKLSTRQEGILEFIREFLDEHHFPPTVRDIQSGCNVSSTSVVDYNLHILQREGYLRRLPEVSRGLELLEDGMRVTRRNIVDVPIVGSIAAGEPLPTPDSVSMDTEGLESIDVSSTLTKGKSNIFALRVKGMSMIDAFVTDGDLVLLEPAESAENGEMVAAWLKDEGEATLKRFYMEGDTVRLQPANESMDPILVPAENVAVRGRVVGVIRSY